MQRISLLVAAMVAACVIYTVVDAAPPAPKYKVVPGAVTKQTPPAHPVGSVGGTFTLVEAPDGYPPISIGADGEPFVSGGACLVYQDTQHVLACNEQADCQSGAPHGPERGFGYCHKDSHTCWFKKDSAVTDGVDGYMLDDYCLKSGPAKTLFVDKVNALPNPKGPPNTTRWRITACQGLTATGCRGVENVDFRTHWGDVLEP